MRDDVPAQAPSPPPMETSHTTELSYKGKDFTKIPLVRPISVPFSFLEAHNASYVVECIRAQGWDSLMSSENELPIYVDMVQEFYTHLKVNPNTLMGRSHVNGIRVNLTPDILAHILQIPNNNGAEFFRSNDWPLSIPRLEVSRMYNPCPTNEFEIRAARLSPQQRILFWIIHDNILPMDGGRGAISMVMLAYLYLLDSHQPINLPRLMMKQMHHITTFHRNTHQGYGAYLTKIFQYFKVPFTSSNVLIPDDFSKFSEQRIRHFHVRVRGNCLVDAREPTPPPAPPTSFAPHEHSFDDDNAGPSTTAGPSHPSMEYDFQSMFASLEGNLMRRMDDRITMMQESIQEQLRRDIKERFDVLDSNFRALRVDMMNSLNEGAPDGDDEDMDED